MRTLLVFLTLVVAGCATVVPAPGPVPAPAPGQGPGPGPELGPPLEPGPGLKSAPLPAPPAHAENLAIAGLLLGARTDAAAGRLVNAAASLERALRIEPRNPRLWQELARVRLKQGDYAQAESTAARSNSWAGSDNALRADNWRIIAHARNARGDAEGARVALEAAERQR
jgi:tetratricopeptide (TPR) repeat protein